MQNALAKFSDKLKHAVPAYDAGSYFEEHTAMLLLSVENTNMINFHFPTEPAKMLHYPFALMLLMCAVEATASDERVPYGLQIPFLVIHVCIHVIS